MVQKSRAVVVRAAAIRPGGQGKNVPYWFLVTGTLLQTIPLLLLSSSRLKKDVKYLLYIEYIPIGTIMMKFKQ